MSDFSWRDGWHFCRLPNGDVEVTKRLPVQERVAATVVAPSVRASADNLAYRHHTSAVEKHEGEWTLGSPFVVVERIVIPAAEWVSILVGVSGAETRYQGEAHELAEALHAGNVIVERIG